MTKKKFAINALLFLIILVYFVLIIQGTQVRDFDLLVYVSFVINIVVALRQLFVTIKNHPYSTEMVMWLFNLIFFGLAPLIQYATAWRAWGLVASDSDFILCNALILLWYFCFIIGKKSKVRFVINKNRIQDDRYRFEIKHAGVKVALCLSMIFTLFLIAFDGFERLIFRGASSSSSFDSSALNMLTYHVFRNFILYTCLILVINFRRTGKNRLMMYISLVCLLIACFPSGISRYMIAAFYMGLIIHIKKKENCKSFFFLLIFGGLVVVFPILNIIRGLKSFYSFEELLVVIPKQFSNTYLSENFDAYQMIISCMHYISANGLSYGAQLIGALLFFVPRSMWPNKPIGSGAHVIKSLNQYEFTNVSMPLMGESYINFGIFGIIIIGVILGIVVKNLDKDYWGDDRYFSFRNVSYPVLAFYFFFMQRGDLMSSGAYLIANCVVGYIVWKMTIDKRLTE